MSKKPKQFRLDEKLLKRLSVASEETDSNLTELVKNAILVYLELHERKMKEGKFKLYIKMETDTTPSELIIIPLL
jgi:hypothetical protein